MDECTSIWDVCALYVDGGAPSNSGLCVGCVLLSQIPENQGNPQKQRAFRHKSSRNPRKLPIIIDCGVPDDAVAR